MLRCELATSVCGEKGGEWKTHRDVRLEQLLTIGFGEGDAVRDVGARIVRAEVPIADGGQSNGVSVWQRKRG